MARDRYLWVCALNIAANPHPDGIYVRLLTAAASYLVRARASDYAKITSPINASEHLYTGRILVWTEIDVNGEWLDLRNEDSLPDALKKQISIPDGAKPNYRTFNYVFNTRNHRLYFESRNEFGENLGPVTAKGIFDRLFSQELLSNGMPEVEVTIIPDERAVNAVLGLPGLRNLLIRVVRPNPDSLSSAAKRRVFDEMDAANAQLAEERYVKASQVPHLTPTERMREWAEVAAENGFVRGEGRMADGKKIEASTDKYPKRIYVAQSQGDTFIQRLLAALSR